jgi:putative membrane protein
MRYTIGLYAVCAAAACCGAWAQAANPAFANPATPGIETGKPEREMVNASDQVFLRTAAVGNRAEAELGKLAADKASAASVKEFARRMSTEHEATLDAVQDLARSSDTPLPGELDMDHRVIMQQLQAAEGTAFDIEYIRSQIADHQRTAKLLEYQIGAGQSDRVRDFAKETLLGVMDHLEMAKAIHADLTGAAP